jgi:hypothetical protein
VFSSLPRLKFILSPPFFDIRIFFERGETDFFSLFFKPSFCQWSYLFFWYIRIVSIFSQNSVFYTFKILQRQGFSLYLHYQQNLLVFLNVLTSIAILIGRIEIKIA